MNYFPQLTRASDKYRLHVSYLLYQFSINFLSFSQLPYIFVERNMKENAVLQPELSLQARTGK